MLLEQERPGVSEHVQRLARPGDQLRPDRMWHGGAGRLQLQQFGDARGLRGGRRQDLGPDVRLVHGKDLGDSDAVRAVRQASLPDLPPDGLGIDADALGEIGGQAASASTISATHTRRG